MRLTVAISRVPLFSATKKSSGYNKTVVKRNGRYYTSFYSSYRISAVSALLFACDRRQMLEMDWAWPSAPTGSAMQLTVYPTHSKRRRK